MNRKVGLPNLVGLYLTRCVDEVTAGVVEKGLPSLLIILLLAHPWVMEVHPI